MDDDGEPQTLLQSVLGFFARRPSPKSAEPAALKARQREAWLRTDAFLQRDHLDDADPASSHHQILVGHISESLTAMQNVQRSQHEQYKRLRRIVESPDRESRADSDTVTRVGKRRRECDDAIQELSNLDQENKRRRILPIREEPAHGSDVEDPNADFAVLMRRHLVSLDNALRRHWVCVCQKCSGLSVRLSLPHNKKDVEAEASFEVFFGVRSVPATALQEARITVKDLRKDALPRRSSEPATNSSSEFAHICQNVSESLGQQNCLHFALEDGTFSRLRPQPKTFGSDRISRTVSLSAFFDRQQELLRGESVLPLKGKRILALTLASALLPFLETPWLQFSFNHSMIQFFEPRQDGVLPDITKPFLSLEHVPIVSARSTTSGACNALKHMVHPNASVLALGILLCELHYCTPVELMGKDPRAARNVNDDFYTCLDKLRTLEDDACEDYFLATKACLTGEYYPVGQHADFDDVSVQRLFYQNVVKRLEAVIFKGWRIRLGDLGSFDSRQIESCWGSIGREVVRSHGGRSELAVEAVVRMSAQLPSKTQSGGHSGTSSEKSLHLFDASYQTVHDEELSLSERWMDSLLSSIYRFVDPTIEHVEPVRIAILDSGLDPDSPFLIEDQQLATPRVREARSFVRGSEIYDVRDEIGHGTHALGLLLKVAPFAEIYVARIARQETLDSDAYNDIAKVVLFKM
ncbi:uncharacterized protein MYCGRDRAFT_93376 [Zymoseptoria tritici IPO323]|uniref:DUF7580 domain-containing protein n=1 Tax=Zymoseptoria tritici (strain CBS 115943 / IPO323) TaxID=336722 RepID=F9XBG3_ZYMTI|nr:uncharacterized protein MYCGRDRAFT_93376 [Zymoseptoria tritici IPO323]EGP87251.1 hypothetical protein MYCGRDRAFT_93376 [Zymoseptoria tritici IPO323]